MNELIIIGVLSSIAVVALVIYATVEIIYQKFILHSKKSIIDILREI